MPTSVHQLVPSVVPGDATTNHTLEVQRVLRNMGCHSEIFATAVHPRLQGRVRLLDEIGPGEPGGGLLYQLSSWSPVADWLTGRPEAVGVNYHNLTPPRFLRSWDRTAARELADCGLQAEQLGRRAGTGICDSAYNAADLRARGWRDPVVAPVLVDFGQFDADPDPAIAAALERRRRDGGAHWLFVGSVTPHKGQHRLVQALAVYRRVYDPRARLSLVGRPVTPTYARAVRGLVGRLGLDDAVDMPGGVDHAALVAYYRAADVFVSASAHEGFCVPVLEAFHHGLPVVAHSAGEFPDTVGEAGILVDDVAPGTLAAAVSLVSGVDGAARRDEMAVLARGRLEKFDLARTRRRMERVLADWMAAAGVGAAAVATSEPAA